MELAHAMLARELFPDAPLKWMPPTKHMTGDVFRGYLLDGFFNLAGALTGQGILLVGWVALWQPAARFVVEVVPHVLNRRRFAEFADIDVRVWVDGPVSGDVLVQASLDRPHVVADRMAQVVDPSKWTVVMDDEGVFVVRRVASSTTRSAVSS
jgi:hypothetical protein